MYREDFIMARCKHAPRPGFTECEPCAEARRQKAWERWSMLKGAGYCIRGCRMPADRGGMCDAHAKRNAAACQRRRDRMKAAKNPSLPVPPPEMMP